jgi:hypothetical protein
VFHFVLPFPRLDAAEMIFIPESDAFAGVRQKDILSEKLSVFNQKSQLWKR